MSYATGTIHYNLPQTVGTDKRDWADTNQAFSDLDAAVYGAVSDVTTAGTAITGLESRMTTAEGNITTNAGNITSLDTRMTTAEGAITSLGSRVSDVSADLEDMICAYNEPTATSTHPYGTGANDNHYFIYNDVLYRATQSIAIGDTIVPDTNCATTNVTTEIKKSVVIDGHSGVTFSIPEGGKIISINADKSFMIGDSLMGVTIGSTCVNDSSQFGSWTRIANINKAFKHVLRPYAYFINNGTPQFVECDVVTNEDGETSRVICSLPSAVANKTVEATFIATL